MFKRYLTIKMGNNQTQPKTVEITTSKNRNDLIENFNERKRLKLACNIMEQKYHELLLSTRTYTSSEIYEGKNFCKQLKLMSEKLNEIHFLPTPIEYNNYLMGCRLVIDLQEKTLHDKKLLEENFLEHIMF